jgi:hypothetical protein
LHQNRSPNRPFFCFTKTHHETAETCDSVGEPPLLNVTF